MFGFQQLIPAHPYEWLIEWEWKNEIKKTKKKDRADKLRKEKNGEQSCKYVREGICRVSIDESTTREGITTVTPVQTHLEQPEQLYT